ncbi:ATP-binding cassette domain-containing protein [bacterium]|nr:ATP-binding cassette domain-containing protein [bacterium]
MNSSAAAISFRGVHKQFSLDQAPVLAGLDLDIKQGEIHVLIGFSGTGKSVTIKHALGLMKPDSGQVSVFGSEIAELNDYQLREMRMNFGMLFQGVALFDSLSVYENIAFPLREHRKEMSEQEIRHRVEELLLKVELEKAIQKMPEELSGGMKKRVGLARAMALKPKILICDEPTTGLDPVTAQVIDTLIEKSTREVNASAFLVSHDIHAAIRIADRISMILEGKIIITESPEGFKRSQHPVVLQFLESAGVV